MLRIRLSRVGRKHDPSYRMIVTEKSRGPQTGNYVEQVGTYDARSDEHDLKADRIEHWLSVGAQPSDTVHNLLVKTGILEADTVNPLPKKSPIVSESEEEDEETETSEDKAESDKTEEAEETKADDLKDEEPEDSQEDSDDTEEDEPDAEAEKEADEEDKE